MPGVYSRNHPLLIEDFRQTGKSVSLYSQRKVYCQHKNGYVFTAWKLIKLFVNSNCESQFVAMIRPTDYNGDKKQDMLLFN